MVITDYIMPEVDGQGVVKHIRGSERGWTPVVGMSGTPWLMPDAGFDLVLIKPFPLNKIVDAVQQLCAGPALPEAASRRRAESPFMQPASL